MKFAIFVFVLAVKLSSAQQINKYWAVEFNSPDDLNQFNQETGAWGWGNNEKQDYTTRNAIINDGNLNIWTHKTTGGGQVGGYTSSRLITKNSFRYGIIEMRAKLPKGRGIWPAFWMLSDKRPLNWPIDGEIDIMEHVGHDQGVVHGTIHTQKYNHGIGTQKGGQLFVADVSEAFHVYKLEWTPKKLVWYIDGRQFFQYNKEANAGYDSWPFDGHFNILINTAVGGWWGGAQGIDDSVFPQIYSVDYVRYFPSNEKPDEIVDPPVVTGPTWNTDVSNRMKWASSCDFYGNDLTSVIIPGALCSARCSATPGCTHFSWTNFQSGTCWMKQGNVDPKSAKLNNDPSSVCGYKYA